MTGYVDLHCHYLPGVDDGVRTVDESLGVLTGLAGLGWTTVVATPHIRTAMFENRAAPLREHFAAFEAAVGGRPGLPTLGLSAEHYCDDVFWDLFLRGEVLPYPGGHAALVEFHYEAWPRHIERRFFDMQMRGVRPVIAHPERYAGLAKSTDPLRPMLDGGALALLDLMSLVGRYGDRARRVAERMLDEGYYDAACTDTHRPEDVGHVERALLRLDALVGVDEARALLASNPAEILAGSYEP